MVGNHSWQMNTQICTVGDVGVLRWWISLITNPLNRWAPVTPSQINVSFLENLGQTSGEYPICRQNLGWSAKSKIHDRLIFSLHMKTLSLVFICRENPRQSGILRFADHPRFCRSIRYSPEVCPRFSRNDTFICDRGTGAQQFRGLAMSEIHRRRTLTWVFICLEWSPTIAEIWDASGK